LFVMVSIWSKSSGSAWGGRILSIVFFCSYVGIVLTAVIIKIPIG
jgi:uncharacterized membrane protein